MQRKSSFSPTTFPAITAQAQAACTSAHRFACIGCTRNATQCRASSGAIILSGRARSAEAGVPRCARWHDRPTDYCAVHDWCHSARFLGRRDRSPVRRPTLLSQRGMRAASAREEREGLLSEHYRAARSLHGTIGKGTPCRRTRASACRHPAGGNSSTCAWQQQPMMRWDGAVEVPPVL